MIVGFVIWTVVSAMLLGIGIWSWKARKAVGFFSGVKPPEVTDTVRYNHAVAVLWFVYAALFELLGIPLLFLKQHKALFVLSMAGVAVISIGLAVAYNVILEKYRRK